MKHIIEFEVVPVTIVIQVLTKGLHSMNKIISVVWICISIAELMLNAPLEQFDECSIRVVQ